MHRRRKAQHGARNISKKLDNKKFSWPAQTADFCSLGFPEGTSALLARDTALS